MSNVKWLTVMEFFVNNSQLFFAILPHALSSLHQCGSRSGSAAPGLRHSYVQYSLDLTSQSLD